MLNIKDLENKIINADCMDVLRQLPDKCIDCILTDPPYEFHKGNCGSGKWTESRSYMKEIIKKHGSDKALDVGITDEFLENTKRLFVVGYNGIFFCNQFQLEQYLRFARLNGYRPTVTIWHKLNPSPLTNNKYLDDVEYCVIIRSPEYKIQTTDYHKLSKIWTSQINKKDKDDYGHPTIKPLDLVSKYVELHTKENDLVLDCFSGSGTTAVACHRLKRRFICIEKDKDYWEASVKRLEDEQRQLSLF